MRIAAYQESPHELWPNLSSDYETYVSALVVQEAQKGDPTQAAARLRAIQPFPILDVTAPAESLAEIIVLGKGIPVEYHEDALHIAVAAVNGMDVLLTWNFAHLNNAFTRMMIRQIVENEGYRCPEICSPNEIIEEGP